MQCKLDPEQSLKDISKRQKQAPTKPLDNFANLAKSRGEDMVQAYLNKYDTFEQVCLHFGISYATVSRVVKRQESSID